MTNTKPRYSLSYVISARKFCVYDRVMGKRTNGCDNREAAEQTVAVLNAAEDKFNDEQAERIAL